MSNDQSEEKTDPASDKKLRDLRDKGIIATAPTASEYVGLGAGLITAFVIAGFMIDRLMGAFDTAFNRLNTTDNSDNISAVKHFMVDLNAPLMWILAAATLGGILFKIISQNGFVFAMERVQPKLDNVNPVNGTKKLFKAETLTSLLASYVRFFALALVIVVIGLFWAPTLLNLDLCVPSCAWPVVWSILIAILITVAVVIIIEIFFDIVTQKHFFLQEQRMTKTEVKRERKDIMGQPEIRSERKRIAREIVEGSDAVGKNRAAIYFFYNDDIVAFAFHPVRIPLPKLAARARGKEASALLRAELEGQGVPGFHHKEIVEASITSALGEGAKREVFMPLAGHLREILS